MKFRCSLLWAGLCALFLLIPAAANANRTYLLVGVRHIYLLGDDPSLYQDERAEIEKTYAECVASDLATAQDRIANGATAADEYRTEAADLQQLAQDRDDCMDELYDKRDDLRDLYPDFKEINLDAPYQLLAIDYHGGTESPAAARENVAGPDAEQQQAVIDYITVMAPWPGYEAGQDTYGGWVIGQRYTTTEFFDHWRTWRARKRGTISIIAMRTHAGEMPFKAGRFVGRREDYVLTRGYAHATGKLHKKGVKKGRRRRGGG